MPPSVHVVLGPSRILGAAIGVAALATLIVVLSLPLPAWQQSALCVAIATWAYGAFRMSALRRSTLAVTELSLTADRTLVARMGDGRLAAGCLRDATYVGTWITCVVWRADGSRRSRAVILVPDMLPPEDFRRLRVMLRYARSAAEHGEPASQA